tara:strand:+ start:217 stop:468 length:252 start_codon:yes stop_codon:yes gene_type:complete
MFNTSIHLVQPTALNVRASDNIDVLNLTYEVRSKEQVSFSLFFEDGTIEEAVESLINALIDTKMELHRERFTAAQGVLFGGDK